MKAEIEEVEELSFEDTVSRFIAKETERLSTALLNTKNSLVLNKLTDDETDDDEIGEFIVKALFQDDIIDSALKRLYLISSKVETYSLFEKTLGTRTNWQILCSAFRKVFTNFGNSYINTQVLATAGLDEFSHALLVLCEDGLDAVNYLESVLHDLQNYLDELMKGRELYIKYFPEDDLSNSFDNRLVEMYATLNTWEEPEDLSNFFDKLYYALNGILAVAFIGIRWVFTMPDYTTVEGILRAVTETEYSMTHKEPPKDITKAGKLLSAILDVELSDGVVAIYQELIGQLIIEYVDSFQEQKKRLLEIVPTKELRDAFKEKFEGGSLFRQEVIE